MTRKINYFRLFVHHWFFITIVTLIIGGIGIALNLTLQQFEYQADIQLLILPNQGNDIVQSTKSAETFGENLTRVITTTSFMDKVVESGKVDPNLFNVGDDVTRKELWNKKVYAVSLAESGGILKISAYDANKQQAANLAQAVADTLMATVGDYQVKDAIKVKQIDRVLVSHYPVRPNVPLVVAVSLLIGFVVSFGYLVLVKEINIVQLLREESKRQAPVAPSLYSNQAKSEPPVVLPEEPPTYHVLDQFPSATPPAYHQNQKPKEEEDQPVSMHDHLRPHP